MKIFISYKSDDRALVQALADHLEIMGHEVWFDQELKKVGGQTWWDAILGNLRAAELVLCALTPAYLESEPCRLEYTYAAALGKTILPLRFGAAVMPALLPPIFAARQIIDVFSFSTEELKTLAQTLRNVPPAPPLPNPLPTPPAVPIARLSLLSEQIDQPNLDDDAQIRLLHELKALLRDPKQADGARILLERLGKHPALRASVLHELEDALPAPPPSNPEAIFAGAYLYNWLLGEGGTLRITADGVAFRSRYDNAKYHFDLPYAQLAMCVKGKKGIVDSVKFITTTGAEYHFMPEDVNSIDTQRQTIIDLVNARINR